MSGFELHVIYACLGPGHFRGASDSGMTGGGGLGGELSRQPKPS